MALEDELTPTLNADLETLGNKIKSQTSVKLDAEEDIILELGDSSGDRKFRIFDSSGYEVAWIDSNGTIKTPLLQGSVNSISLDSLIAKVSAIQDGADVTDAGNVTAAGALMQSQVDLDGITSLTLPNDVTISTFVKTLLNASDEATFRSLIQAEAEGALAVPDASMTTKGRIELATQDEVNTGTDTVKAVTPSTLANYAQWAIIAGGGGVTAYTHPNHSGDVTSSGDGAQTLQPVAITGKPTDVPASGDRFLFADASDGFDLKEGDVADLALVAVPDATYAVKGKLEIATQAEVDAGTDDTRAVTPLTLSNYNSPIGVPNATDTVKGILELATQAEVDAGVVSNAAVTPATLNNWSGGSTDTDTNIHTWERTISDNLSADAGNLIAFMVAREDINLDKVTAQVSGISSMSFFIWVNGVSKGAFTLSTRGHGFNRYMAQDINIPVSAGQLIQISFPNLGSGVGYGVAHNFHVELRWSERIV